MSRWCLLLLGCPRPVPVGPPAPEPAPAPEVAPVPAPEAHLPVLPHPRPPGFETRLQGHRWTLRTLDGAPATGERSFEISGLEVTVFTGCNHLFGRVEVGENSIDLGPLAGTAQPCPEADDERAFVTLLEEVDGWRLDADELALLVGETVRATLR